MYWEQYFKMLKILCR